MFNLPRIETKGRKIYRDHLTNRDRNSSPLAAELNFIYKSKGLKPRNTKKYTIKQGGEDSCRLQRYLNQNSKYNIYEKCVVEIKKSQTSPTASLEKKNKAE